jgi:hypothetical protein
MFSFICKAKQSFKKPIRIWMDSDKPHSAAKHFGLVSLILLGGFIVCVSVFDEWPELDQVGDNRGLFQKACVYAADELIRGGIHPMPQGDFLGDGRSKLVAGRVSSLAFVNFERAALAKEIANESHDNSCGSANEIRDILWFHRFLLGAIAALLAWFVLIKPFLP